MGSAVRSVDASADACPEPGLRFADVARPPPGSVLTVTADCYSWSSELDQDPRFVPRGVRQPLQTRSDRSCPTSLLLRLFFFAPVRRRPPDASADAFTKQTVSYSKIRTLTRFAAPNNEAELLATGRHWLSGTPMRWRPWRSRAEVTARPTACWRSCCMFEAMDAHSTMGARSRDRWWSGW